MRRLIIVTLFITIVLTGQEVTKITIRVGPSEPPLAAASCKESSYGNLHNGDRTKLTEQEVGEYILRTLRAGNIITIHPESKSGIFVYARCPNTEPKDAQ